jgi:hypothetical protein
MTYRKNGTVFIEAEPESTCELCGKTAETRPYGPGGCRVCFQCGMLDEEATMRRFGQLLDPSN